MEGPIFGGAYVRREICVSKSIGLACSGKEIYHFYFVLLCIQGQIPSTSPPGSYIRRGDLTEGFLRYDFRGLIFGGACTWRGLFSELYGSFTTTSPPTENLSEHCSGEHSIIYFITYVQLSKIILLISIQSLLTS